MERAKTSDGRGTPKEFLAFQRLAWSNLVFSVTRRCPLTCSHCITSSGPAVSGSSLSVPLAERLASSFPSLFEEGLRHVTFTGGEPVLELKAVLLMANAAQEAGIRTSLVTSCAWATSKAAAQNVVTSLEAISHWDIGYDEYHAESLPWSRLVTALESFRAANASFSIRLCESSKGANTAAWVNRIREVAGPEVPIIVQSVRQIGRGASLSLDRVNHSTEFSVPCLSTGPFIRGDGSTGPCCAGLAYEATGLHPFDYGNCECEDLVAVWRRWREDQLLRFIRLLGFALPVRWLKDEGVLPQDFEPAGNVCETCVKLWTFPRAGDVLRRISQLPEVREKLDAVERHLYGDLWKASRESDQFAAESAPTTIG